MQSSLIIPISLLLHACRQAAKMSRVCVKNLPRYLTDERLREHFSAGGQVTDAKIIRTSDGRSRQLGFVGYRTEEEAQAAVNYFHRSFIDTSRLICEIAKPIGDPNLPRPWSRHSYGSSAYGGKVTVNEEQSSTASPKPQSKTSIKNAGQNVPEDTKLLEFLEVMQPRSKSKLWADDTTAVNQPEAKRKGHLKADGLSSGKSKKKDNQPKNDSLENAGAQPLRDKGTGKRASKLLQVHFEDESGEEDAALNDGVPEIDTDIPVAKRDNLIGDETVSDLDYLKSRTKRNWSDEDEDSDSHLEEDEIESPVRNLLGNEVANTDLTDGNEDSQVDAAFTGLGDANDKPDADANNELVSAEQQESVAETGRLFVRNLSYTTSENDLEGLFSQFGELSHVHLVLDKDTKRSKGLAYILYMLPECAVRAMEALDKSTFQGRLIHILPAKRPPPIPEKALKRDARAPGMSQFKQDREAQKRAVELTGNARAWNSLFMRSDTVAENIARKYGLSKSDFLDPEAEDLAVRMALGETHIIAETKKALSEEGINVDVLEELASGKLDDIKRSSHVILVKNLPYMTLDTDLVAMFGKFGTLERVVLPPTKTLALVVYLEASEACAAFKGLAYKRFKHVPLYLEWAPDNILTGKPSRELDGIEKRFTTAIGEAELKRVVVEQQITAPTDADTDFDSAESRSVFIKNLNFKTTEIMLRNHFQQIMKEGSLRSVKIKMKPAKSGKLLSMGFGFIEFDKPETAKDVCKQFQGTILEGHALVLQLSHGKKETEAVRIRPLSGKLGNNESSTKLIVRNVAFEATKKDLQQLFGPFGQIKSLRLPKKFDGHHRGFAFLEFLTKQEAENAYNALLSTHLYGRHLVLERAKEGESLEELRTRTATQCSEEVNQLHGSSRPSKKRKQNSIDDADMRFGQITQ